MKPPLQPQRQPPQLQRPTAPETTAAPESSSEEAISAVDIFTDETSYMITNVNSTNVLEANSGEIADQWYDFGGIECRWYLKPAGTAATI